MFEKFVPKNIKEEINPKIKDTISDQLEIGKRKTDLSIEDFSGEINKAIKKREVIEDKEGPVEDGYSWEELKREEQLDEKLHELRIKFAALKEEIKERQVILNELRYTKSGISSAVRNLNLKDMSSRERDVFVVETMRNAEDRLERINSKIISNEMEIAPLYKELGQIQEMINSIAILMDDPEKNTEKTVGEQKYDFTQN